MQGCVALSGQAHKTHLQVGMIRHGVGSRWKAQRPGQRICTGHAISGRPWLAHWTILKSSATKCHLISFENLLSFSGPCAAAPPELPAHIAFNSWDHQHRWISTEAVSRNMAESLAELLAQAAPRGPSALRSGQAGGAALALALHCEPNLAWRPGTAARRRRWEQTGAWALCRDSSCDQFSPGACRPDGARGLPGPGQGGAAAAGLCAATRMEHHGARLGLQLPPVNAQAPRINSNGTLQTLPSLQWHACTCLLETSPVPFYAAAGRGRRSPSACSAPSRRPQSGCSSMPARLTAGGSQ